MTNPGNPSNSPYVPFDRDLLQSRPGGTDVIDKLVEELRRNNEWTFKKFGHGLRDAHSKSHAVLHGELSVDDNLDERLAQGLFATPGKKYDVIARISSTFPTIRSDQIRGIRAIAQVLKPQTHSPVAARQFVPCRLQQRLAALIA